MPSWRAIATRLHGPDSAGRRQRRTVTGAVALLAIAIAGLCFAPVALGWDANTYSSTSEQQLFRLTNQARASAGLRSLKWDSALASIARWRSKDMITRNYFSHQIPPSGKSVFDVMQSKGYCFKLAGENIGWNNYPDDAATAAIQQAFMDSSGHRANIMGKAWDVAAVGAYKGPSGKKMWTVLFADKCGTTTTTPKPTPRPTPKPTPKPAPKATPRPTAAATPKAAPKATPAPNPTATPTPAPTPTPTPDPADAPPRDGGLGLGPGGQGGGDGGGGENGNGGQSGNGPPPGQTSLRVSDPPAAQGLVETIVGDVAGFFFGS
jgi:uncharacterized protein YkwD